MFVVAISTDLAVQTKDEDSNEIESLMRQTYERGGSKVMFH